MSAVGAGLKLRVGPHRADMELGGWDVFNRYPRISSLYAMDQSTFQVANPFGGGLYVEVPDGTDLGTFTLQVQDAVKMPMYSTLDLVGHSDDLAAFQAEADAWNVPWFEMHGRNFSTTLPMNEVQLYTDPAALLERWEDAFDQISLMAGRPAERIRSEWPGGTSTKVRDVKPSSVLQWLKLQRDRYASRLRRWQSDERSRVIANVGIQNAIKRTQIDCDVGH